MSARNHLAVHRDDRIDIHKLVKPAHSYLALVLANVLAAFLGEIHNPCAVMVWLLLAIIHEPFNDQWGNSALLSALSSVL